MSSVEQETFLVKMSQTVRALHRQGRLHNTQVWNARLKSMREKFVEVEGFLAPLDFEEKELWDSGRIKFQNRTSNFFILLETLIRTLDMKSATSVTKKELVINELYKPDHEKLLDHWFWLTVGNFSETESINFLEDLIQCVINVSGKAEVEHRKREIEAKLRTQKVALRTDLKRN